MKVLQERIDEITTLIAEVANGNFDYKLEVSETGDELDAVIFGVNMLGQELKNSTVSRDVMQSIYQGVVDMLLVLNQDFTIRNVNEAIEEMLGFQEADLLEKVFTSLLDPSEIPLFSSYMETLKRHGKCRDVEIQLITAKGDAIPTSCSFSYLRNNQKQIEGILIIAKDISKIKETERELKEAKDKAVNANEAKSRFLSSMSHEIRTPLNGIMGFTDLLLDSELNRTQTQYANLIKTSGKTLTKLLSDILDLNKIEQDKISFEMVSFDIRDSIISNLAPYKHIAESKKISYSYTFDERIPKSLIGDPVRVNQVLINLVSNAIKFTDEGGVELKLFLDDTARPRNPNDIVLKFEIIDTGIGIPKEKQHMVFEYFTQTDSSYNRRFGGFGLGLTICKKLVERMSGEIGLMSPPPRLNIGSLFWFTVQLQRDLNQNNEVAIEVQKKSDFRLKENVKILLVDDNDMNVMLMQDVLSNMGAEVTTAVNGLEAIDVALEYDFDLVFMDINMPEMDGLEATVKLREAKYTKPIISFSANAFDEDVQKSKNAGMNDCLKKPFTREELIRILKEWIP